MAGGCEALGSAAGESEEEAADGGGWGGPREARDAAAAEAGER